jgi:hypothetical protein
VQDLNAPAGPGSMSANLARANDGGLVLTWIEPLAPRGHALKMSAYSDGAWSEARTIATGRDWFVTQADVPTVAVLTDGTLVASWLANHVAGTEAANIHLSRSTDGGATWTAPVIPHRDRHAVQHGFLSLVPAPSGALEALWLDGRQTSGAAGHGHGGDMALMHATIAADGTVGAETMLDGRVCDCCPVSAAATAGGVLAVYRDRSEQEVRDISIVRHANGAWSRPEPLTKDAWQINACPVNGPEISVSGAHVAVAWFTAASNEARVQAMLSADGGRTFGAPVRIDASRPAGRVDVVSLSEGGALVSWVERAEHGPEARVRHVTPRGVAAPVSISSPAIVAAGAAPRMQPLANGDVVVAWTEAGKPTRVRATILRWTR